MKKLNNLTVVILTYNRPIQIAKIIFEILYFSKIYGFKIIILDDSSNNITQNYFKEISKLNKNLKYYKNKKNLGHDKNYEKALILSETYYTWIIGDSTRISKNFFQKLNKELNFKNDLIIVGALNRSEFLLKKFNFLNKNETLKQFSWYLSLLGSSILSRKIVKNRKYINFAKYKNFPHIGLIFYSIFKNKIKIKIVKESIISSFNKESYWFRNIFNVFLDDWSKTIYNLRGYDDVSKFNAIINHAKYSKIFNFKNLLILRSEKIYDLKSFNKFNHLLKKFTNYNILVHFLILILPSNLLNIAFKVFRKIKYKYINES